MRRIAALYELPLAGDDAQGGAGHKALLTLAPFLALALALTLALALAPALPTDH